MSEINVELDRLLDQLEPSPPVPAPARPADAIDRVRRSPVRTTAARSLRDDEVIRRFREEVTSGLIRVDTVRQLLGLIRLALEVRPT